jgi:hypothetical protein
VQKPYPTRVGCQLPDRRRDRGPPMSCGIGIGGIGSQRGRADIDQNADGARGCTGQAQAGLVEKQSLVMNSGHAARRKCFSTPPRRSSQTTRPGQRGADGLLTQLRRAVDSPLLDEVARHRCSAPSIPPAGSADGLRRRRRNGPTCYRGHGVKR